MDIGNSCHLALHPPKKKSLVNTNGLQMQHVISYRFLNSQSEKSNVAIVTKLK